MDYFLIHKPYGMLSQFTREGGHLALSDLEFSFPKNVYSVGRLDQDSEGLLIITNDNLLRQKLTDPKSEKTKTYLVQVDGQITDEALKLLEKGLKIKHKGKTYQTLPAKADHFKGEIPEERDPPVRFRKNIPTSWLTLSIGEGKNRQVRKMTAAVGFPTLRLIRIGIENLNLENLPLGKVKKLSKEEIYRSCRIKR
ncbi:pseudouridine synthase [Jiulongibacter sp. NS-SX5]|uniref:pseudouridine synthase n=1 Tax=Jiulongibacter sp. NS-SX5 TaxID=3463854 RepID=UPI00405942D4